MMRFPKPALAPNDCAVIEATGHIPSLKNTRRSQAGYRSYQPTKIVPRYGMSVKDMARVLVDAPCSNTGTVRRNPDVLWRPLDLDTLTALQRRILDSAAKLVAPGGRLVYATCSVLREETEGVVAAFLAAYPDFCIVPASEIFQRLGVNIPDAVTPDGFMRLLPHRHRTDGFRAAVLERRNEG